VPPQVAAGRHVREIINRRKRPSGFLPGGGEAVEKSKSWNPETHGAAVAAVREKSILSGMRIERSEVGRPGEFEAFG
jgi:hypothetical protein